MSLYSFGYFKTLYLLSGAFAPVTFRNGVVMGGEERLSVRLPSDAVILLSELVSRKQYSNEAAAVRDAVRIFLESKFTDAEMSEIISSFKSKPVYNLNDFTSDAEDVSAVLGNVIDRGLSSERKD